MEEKVKIPDDRKLEEKTKSITGGKNGTRSKQVIDGITVSEVYREGGRSLWECLLSAMGRV